MSPGLKACITGFDVDGFRVYLNHEGNVVIAHGDPAEDAYAAVLVIPRETVSMLIEAVQVTVEEEQ